MPRSRTRPVAGALLALYALVLVVLPLAHHDFACHTTAPMHCDACVASPVVTAAPQVVHVAMVATSVPLPRGSGERPTSPETMPIVPGRAPPHAG